MIETDTKLSNSFSLGGYWWLPNKPEQEVYGTLNYQPDIAPELILEGSFQDFTSDSSNYLSNVVIYGMTARGITVTLVDAYQKSSRMNMPGIPTSEFFCNRLFIGKEFISPDKAKFESALVEFSNLYTWLSRYPFKRKNPNSIKKENIWEISYTMPKLIFTSVNSIQASIKFEPSICLGGENQTRQLSHRDYVRFRPKRKQDLNWYLDMIFSFRIFLSLLVGQSVNPISIKLCTKRRMDKRLGKKYFRDYVDFCVPHYQSKLDTKLYPHDILIPYSPIKRNFQLYLNNWYQNKDILKTTCQLLFGVLVQKNIPVDFQFLALVQAFESYHRATNEGKYISNSSYEPVKQVIIDAIPSSVSSGHRAALKSRIKYGNEYSLRKRFGLTLDSMPERLRNKITKNDSKFTSKVVATRNYLTHRDESDKDNVMDTLEIRRASESLQIFIISLILNEIGIDFQTFEKAISNNWRIKRILKID